MLKGAAEIPVKDMRGKNTLAMEDMMIL